MRTVEVIAVGLNYASHRVHVEKEEGVFVTVAGKPPSTDHPAANGGGRYELREFPAERKRIDIGDYYADDALFRRITGWKPETPVEEGLKRSLEYFRENLAAYL